MAFRTWARILLATLGVGALAGASQLGVAYGLGVVRLTRIFDVAGRDQWHAQLAWVAWFAMVAAVLAGLAGGRFHQRWTRADDGSAAPGAAPLPAAGSDESGREPVAGLWTRIAVAAAAGVGASAVVPLTMQPARTAMIDAVEPTLVIGICAGLGALVGVFAAYAALSHVVARWSFGALIGAVWLIAVVSVAPSLGPADPLPIVRLGVFDAGYLSPATTQRFALFTMPALALLAGALLGWAGRRREFPPGIVALAGLPGPALVTAAYLIAGPGGGGQRYQVIPYWAAMAAVGTGVLGAVIAAVIRRGTATDHQVDPADGSGDADPGSAMPPLPRRSSGVSDPAVGEPAPDAPRDAGPAHLRPLGGNPLMPAAPVGAPVPRPYDAGSLPAPAPDARPGPATRDRRAGHGSHEPGDMPYAGPYPPALKTPPAPRSHLEREDVEPVGAAAARSPGGVFSRGLPGFGRSRPVTSAPDPAVRHDDVAAAPVPSAAQPAARPARTAEPSTTPPQSAGSPPGGSAPSGGRTAQPSRAGHPSARVGTPDAPAGAVVAATPTGLPVRDITPAGRGDQPGQRADRGDQPGRRAARDADVPIGKKDEDFVDWVSGLGSD